MPIKMSLEIREILAGRITQLPQGGTEHVHLERLQRQNNTYLEIHSEQTELRERKSIPLSDFSPKELEILCMGFEEIAKKDYSVPPYGPGIAPDGARHGSWMDLTNARVARVAEKLAGGGLTPEEFDRDNQWVLGVGVGELQLRITLPWENDPFSRYAQENAREIRRLKGKLLRFQGFDNSAVDELLLA